MKDTSPSNKFLVNARTTKTKTTQLISVRLPEELLERLAAVGNTEGFAMSDTIRVVLERGLRSTPKNQPTKKKGTTQ